MDYVMGAGLIAAGAAIFILLKPLRPVALLAFTLAGYTLRDGLPGDLVRQGLSISGKWLGEHGAAQFVPYLGIVAAILAAVVLIVAVIEWDVGVGAVIVALAFPALLVLSGSSPPATHILAWFGWAVDKIQTATVTKGTR